MSKENSKTIKVSDIAAGPVERMNALAPMVADLVTAANDKGCLCLVMMECHDREDAQGHIPSERNFAHTPLTPEQLVFLMASIAEQAGAEMGGDPSNLLAIVHNYVEARRQSA